MRKKILFLIFIPVALAVLLFFAGLITAPEKYSSLQEYQQVHQQESFLKRFHRKIYAGFSDAGKWNQALGKLTNGKIQKAEQYFLLQAQQGDASAALILGKLYLRDHQQFKPNYERAKYFLELAAKAGLEQSYSDLVDLYRFGLGTEKNPELAKEYAEKGIQSGNIQLNNVLGEMYFNGEFGVEDYGLAFKYFKIAADQNDPSAMVNLAMLYRRGLSVPKNLDQANLLLEKALKAGAREANRELALLYYEISKFQHAYRFGLHALEYPSMALYIMMGELLSNNDIPTVKKDYFQAIRYFEEAMKLGSKQAFLHLGDMYHKGLGVKVDHKRAYYFYELANDANIPLSFYKLGIYYHYGYHIEKNLYSAALYYKQAVSLGVEAANYNLAKLYIEEKDYGKAEYYAFQAQLAGIDTEDLNYDLRNYVTRYEIDFSGIYSGSADLTSETLQAFLIESGLDGQQVNEVSEENEEQAIALYETQARAGDILAIEILVMHYQNKAKQNIDRQENALEAYRWTLLGLKLDPENPVLIKAEDLLTLEYSYTESELANVQEFLQRF